MFEPRYAVTNRGRVASQSKCISALTRAFPESGVVGRISCELLLQCLRLVGGCRRVGLVGATLWNCCMN